MQVQPAILTSPSSREDIAGLRFEFLFKFAGLKKTALSYPPREDIAGFCVIWIKTAIYPLRLERISVLSIFFKEPLTSPLGREDIAFF